MSSISIKLTIAGRTYPLTIQRDEEESLRKAAKDIEQNLVHFQENYAVKDKQDLLAMTALQMATQVILLDKKSRAEDETRKLKEIDFSLSNYLDNNEV